MGQLNMMIPANRPIRRAWRSLAIDCLTPTEEAMVAQCMYVAERRQ